MLILILSLVASAPLGLARDTPKTKSVGSLSHSIINLGKMDINLYINDKRDKKGLEELLYPNYHGHHHSHESPKSQFEILHPSRSQTVLRSEPFTGACPCTSVRSAAAAQRGPQDLLSRILMDNDLFSFHNDPANSPHCCTSHEQIQEEFIIEFGPKPNPSQNQMRSPQNTFYTQPHQLLPKVFPYLPFLTENFQSKGMTGKPLSKQIDIFLYPTKKGGKIVPKLKPIARTDIQVVGDKKTTMLLDVAPTKSSVKKDLTQGKVDTGIDTAENVKVTAGTNSNTL